MGNDSLMDKSALRTSFGLEPRKFNPSVLATVPKNIITKLQHTNEGKNALTTDVMHVAHTHTHMYTKLIREERIQMQAQMKSDKTLVCADEHASKNKAT